jgi:hypothetical protein
MTIRQYLAIMITSTVLSTVAWLFVIIQVDPYTGGYVGVLFFYASLALALFGIVSLISFGILQLAQKHSHPMYKRVGLASIIGLCTTALLTLLLILQSADVLRVWNVMILLFVVLCLGLFKLSIHVFQQ